MTTTSKDASHQLDLTGLAILCDDIQATNAIIGGNVLSGTELGFVDGVTAGTALASKALVLGAAKEIATITTITSTTNNTTTENVGASGTAGTLNVFPTTASKGKLSVTASDATGNTTTTVNVAAQAGAVTYTIPDAGASASFVMTGGAQTIGGSKTLTAQLNTAAGTTAIAPILHTAGTNLTTATAGAVEYDGVCFYDTAVASSRQVRDVEQFVCLTANGPTDNNSLLDASTAAAVFRTPTNGTITVAGLTSYFFEAVYKLSNTGTTSHTWSVLFAGAATLTSISYQALAYTAVTAGTTITAVSGIQGVSATATVVTAASTSATEFVTVVLKGIMRVNAGGTFIPQMQASARPGASGTPGVIVLAGSYFRLNPVGSNTVASVGNWS